MSLVEPVAILIVFGSFFASFISATFAVGGGFIMLAILSSALPITSAVPLHSWMMLGLSLGRFWYFRKEINWQIVIPLYWAPVSACLPGAGSILIYRNFC